MVTKREKGSKKYIFNLFLLFSSSLIFVVVGKIIIVNLALKICLLCLFGITYCPWELSMKAFMPNPRSVTLTNGTLETLPCSIGKIIGHLCVTSYDGPRHCVFIVYLQFKCCCANKKFILFYNLF